jgi:hypothetical protein
MGPTISNLMGLTLVGLRLLLSRSSFLWPENHERRKLYADANVATNDCDQRARRVGRRTPKTVLRLYPKVLSSGPQRTVRRLGLLDDNLLYSWMKLTNPNLKK